MNGYEPPALASGIFSSHSPHIKLKTTRSVDQSGEWGRIQDLIQELILIQGLTEGRILIPA